MNIFVTGGAGFVGSHMVARLVREGHTVTAYDNLLLGRREFLEDLIDTGRCTFVEADLLDRITAFPGRPKAGRDFVNLTSAALYVCRRDLVRHIPADRPTDFARDIFPERLAAGADLFAYETDEYIHDLGTPERYSRVVADVRRMIDERSGSLFRP